MSSILIRGGRVIDPGTKTDQIADILVEVGVVTKLGQNLSELPQGYRLLDATGLVVTPGFIDLHTHLRFPGFPEKETIESGTHAAAAGGFTTICAMANTDPVVDNIEVLRHVQETVAREAIVRVRQLGAVTQRLEGWEMNDLPALAAAGAVAFSDDGKPIWNTLVMADALRASAELGKTISVHEEDPEIVRGGVANAGKVARELGLTEWPCSGEASMVQRDIALLEEIGGHLHIAHVSCAESVALIRDAKARGLPLTAEVTPHHLMMHDSLLRGLPLGNLSRLDPRLKVNPPLRTLEDMRACLEGLMDGTIDALATDHAPHTAADKSVPFLEAAFGFSGIELALPFSLGLLRRGLTLPQLIARLTTGPARVFGLDASVQPGSVADITVFDPEEEWDITEEALHSRGKNTPLLGMSLPGRVRWTVVGGDVAYEL